MSCSPAPAPASALLERLVPGLTPLPPALARAIDESGAVIERAAGDTLVEFGGCCAGMLLLERGTLRVKVASESGASLTLHRACVGEPCGQLLRCLHGPEPYSASCEVETALRGVLLPPGLCDRLILESAAFRRFVFDSLEARLRALSALACTTAFDALDRRLAAVLLARLERAGDAGVAVTHQQLADELGCTREAASRVLERFASRGVVRLGRGRVVVRDRPALQGLGGRVAGVNDSLRQRAVSSPRPDRLASTPTM